MQIYKIGKVIDGLIFDMDNTLYTNPAYTQHQEDVLILRLAQEFNWSEEEGKHRVNDWRENYAKTHQGRKPSLGNTFLGLGIPIETSVQWRCENLRPELFLQKNTLLIESITLLSQKFRLAIVTNNPVEVARKTLEILGILDFIPRIVGLDSTNVSKPDPAAFRMAAVSLTSDSSRIVSIGDRYEVDIEPALALGMGGILVEHVEEVYDLPNFFHCRNTD